MCVLTGRGKKTVKKKTDSPLEKAKYFEGRQNNRHENWLCTKPKTKKKSYQIIVKVCILEKKCYSYTKYNTHTKLHI